jgi:hypothetical protein
VSSDTYLPEVNQHPNFKKSFFLRFNKEKRDRINSLIRNHMSNKGENKVEKASKSVPQKKKAI